MIILIISIAVTLISIYLTYYFYSRRLSKVKKFKTENEHKIKIKLNDLENQINIKNKQISSCFFELQQIRSSISNLESILKEIENVLPDDKKSLVNELQINIKKCLFVEKKWKNFHSYFEESQFRFHKTLLLRYNDLKPNDLKICSLLRLNLSIKESADILGISHDSLKASRYRLRKKLGLKPRESILNYLISLEKQNLNLNQNNFNH